MGAARCEVESGQMGEGVARDEKDKLEQERVRRLWRSMDRTMMESCVQER